MDVKDSMTLKDETIEVRLQNPESACRRHAHRATWSSDLVWVTAPPPARSDEPMLPWVSVGDALRKANISDFTIVGGHGTTAKQADIAQALAAN